MQRSLLAKLRGEVKHYQNKDFMKATMAVCALAITADDKVQAEELDFMESLVKSDLFLDAFPVQKARSVFKDYLGAVKRDGDEARQILYRKVSRMVDQPKRARTLLRVAYLVISSDHELHPQELREFRRLCGLLDFDPGMIWEELAGGEPVPEGITVRRG